MNQKYDCDEGSSIIIGGWGFREGE